MKILFLIIVGLSILQADFIKVGDTVKENISKLQWQDDGANSIESWITAIEYCENLSLENYTDWRLPNINELKSISDKSKTDVAVVSGFTNILSYNYWSSTTYQNLKDHAYCVNFENASTYHFSKAEYHYVRCVRDGD